jgi:hypothetical protein
MPTQTYPTCCTSFFCGEGECPPDCRNLPTLLEFKAQQHPRCSGCGTHNHSADVLCPNAPPMSDYMDDSWGDHSPCYDY